MRIRTITLTAILALAAGLAGGSQTMAANDETRVEYDDTATLGGGCFWCLEAVFEEMEGVSEVVSGYAGGEDLDPTYKEVCSGETGHAEVVQIRYDAEKVSFRELLAVFFTIHDPTTLNRQGADVGTQYRSAIFTHSEHQLEMAREMIAELERDKVYKNRVVTQVEPIGTFFAAEDYHQDYYRNNRGQGYCRVVIDPKLDKFRQKFGEKRKK